MSNTPTEIDYKDKILDLMDSFHQGKVNFQADNLWYFMEMGNTRNPDKSNHWTREGFDAALTSLVKEYQTPEGVTAVESMPTKPDDQ